MDPVVPPDWPVAGRDYPADWAQFQAWFPDEAACLRYLGRLSWPHGFLCPACGDDRRRGGGRGSGWSAEAAGTRPRSPLEPCSRGRGRRCASGSRPPGWWPRPSRACRPASSPRP